MERLVEGGAGFIPLQGALFEGGKVKRRERRVPSKKNLVRFLYDKTGVRFVGARTSFKRHFSGKFYHKK